MKLQIKLTMDCPGVFLTKDEEEYIIKDIKARLEEVRECPEWMLQLNIKTFELYYKFEQEKKDGKSI